MNRETQFPIIYVLSSMQNLITLTLDHNTYISWFFQMENLLQSLDLMGYIDGSCPSPPQFLLTDNGITTEVTREFMEWNKNDKAVLSFISATISSEALSSLVGSRNSREAWLNLRNKYYAVSRFDVMQLKINLHTLQKNNDSIDKYLQRVKSIRDELAFVGVHFPDEDIIILALNGLPPEYNTIKVVIKAMDKFFSMEEFRSQLLAVERDFEKTMVLQTQNTMSSNAGTYSNNSSRSVKYGMSSPGMPSHAILSSQYTGNCSMAPALDNAASNAGFLPNVINNSVLSGIPAYNHFNTSSSSSKVHHYYAPSPVSSSVLNVPTAAPNCQAMVPFTPNIGIPQSAPNSRSLLSNSVGNENFTLIHSGASLSSGNLASDHPRSINSFEEAVSNGSTVQVPSASATVQASASIMEKDTNETVTDGETGNVEKTENEEKREKKDETADPSTEGVTLNSFQKLSSSQNAFTNLSGTGFSTSTISFGLISKDGPALRTSSGSLFELKNALPSGLGLSNNGSSSLFATAGPSIVPRSDTPSIVSKEQEFRRLSTRHQPTKQLMSTPSNKTTLYCRQASHLVKLCPSLPLIPPG